MPDRILRDEIWESERFLDLPTDVARLAFIRFLSLADDFGNFEGGPRRMFRILQACTTIKTEEAAAHALDALMQADLIRRYEIDGRELFHIPKLRPHRQYLVKKMPDSPWDKDAKIGKTRRIVKRYLSKDQELEKNIVTTSLPDSNRVPTTSLPDSNHVAEGVGVGVGVGEVLFSVANATEKPNSGAVGSPVPDCPQQEIVDLYHEKLPLCPRVREWNDARQRCLRARWREKASERHWTSVQEGLELFAKLFDFIGESRFLTGRARAPPDKPPFVADLGWIVRPNNWAKIIEGKYHESV